MVARFTYIKELTVASDISIAVGTQFIKTWRVKNSGDSAWEDGFTLRFQKGTAMTDQHVHPLPHCQPGQTVDISVPMTAPNKVGTFWGDWYLEDADGNRFGDLIWTRIVCKKPKAIGAGSPNLEFIEDVTVPDGTKMNAGEVFDKVWRVRNTGNVPWTDEFELAHIDGVAMTDQTAQDVPNALVGEVIDVAIRLSTPATPGNHSSYWRFRNPSKHFFGDQLFAQIVTRQAVDANASVNALEFISDVTIQDDSEIEGGTKFTKTWRVRNTGNIPWGSGYTLRFINGEPMTTKTTVLLPACQPGKQVDISVALTAPRRSGTHFSDWRCYGADGNPFGEIVWLRIVVPSPGVDVDTVGSGAFGSLGGSAPVNVPRVEIPVIHYSQRDPRWRDKHLGLPGSGVTIGSWGCLMTVMTMFANWKGKNIAPPDFMGLMLQKGGFFGSKATAWNALQKVYSDIKADSFEPITTGDLINRINSKLDQKIPVITQVDRTPDNAYTDADQHWVLVIGRNGPTDYWVNDPIELGGGPTSLGRRYGRPGQGLRAAIISILPYQ